jgi:DNA primase
MTININDELLDKIKDNCDIVTIISDYVSLKKSGTNYIGLCPFHNEKTPSFSVSESKQFFHCFGCGEGGDVLTFIMKKENLDFKDAVQFLADKCGIEIEKDNVNVKLNKDKLVTFEINKKAARYFFKNLLENKNALSYLEKRRISYKAIRQFGLGYSYDSWDRLYKYLKDESYTDEEIERTGLIVKKKDNNSYYDRFRNRIIFPIIDTKSNILGFGGRVLDKSLPKYLNSPDTIVFNKGNHLYGLNLLNKFSNRKRILLVEGYMDVISLFDKGINYCVASLGTALTERQSKLIKRFGEEVYICYDSDTAGIKATLKAIEIMLKIDVIPRIISLPEGMDPDDFINKKGLAEFERLFTNSLSYIDFKVKNVKKKYNMSILDDKIKFTKEVSKIIKDIKSPIEQDGYIEKISSETGISKDAIEKEIRGHNYYKDKFKNDIKTTTKLSIKPVDTIIPSASYKAEIELLKFMIKEKDYYEYIKANLNVDNFDTIESKNIIMHLDLLYHNNDLIDEKVLFNKILEIPNLNRKFIDLVFDTDLTYQPTNVNKVIDDLIKTVSLNKLQKRRNEVLSMIEILEKKVKNEEEENMFKKLCFELINLNNELDSIKK